jgi:hypothetical protein
MAEVFGDEVKGVIYETMLQAICVRASDLIRF